MSGMGRSRCGYAVVPVVLVLGAALAGCVGGDDGPKPDATADALASGLATGDLSRVRFVDESASATQDAYKSALDIVADVRAERLRIVLRDKLSAPAPLHALYHRNQHQPPRVKLLLDFLQERFATAATELDELGLGL